MEHGGFPRDHHDHHGHDHSSNENIFAILLHVIGDFLTAIGVIFSTVIVILCRRYIPNSDRYTVYIDPTVSILIAAVLFFPTIPLVIRCSKVLMQAVPDHIHVSEIRQQLEQISGVSAVSELHIWSLLIREESVASVHLVVDNMQDDDDDALEKLDRISSAAKNILMKCGIQSSTIQLNHTEQKLDHVQVSVHAMHEEVGEEHVEDDDDNHVDAPLIKKM